MDLYDLARSIGRAKVLQKVVGVKVLAIIPGAVLLRAACNTSPMDHTYSDYINHNIKNRK